MDSLQGLLEIEYYYKPNGGQHTALNIGFEAADTELVLQLGSDDVLVEMAVQIISESWKKWRNRPEIGHMRFLMQYPDGSVIGDKFPADEFVSNYIETEVNGGLKGDKCHVFRTSVIKMFKFPVIENERHIGKSSVWLKIGREYSCVFYNTVIYTAEYLADGMTKAGRRVRINNPNGHMLNANEAMRGDIVLKVRIKKAILYGTYGFFAGVGVFRFIKNSNAVFLSIICLPVSYVLYLRWKGRYK
jgi:glycosyltransferase involved in cell wall biosynthesis